MTKKKSGFSVAELDKLLSENAIHFDYATIEGDGSVKYHKKGNTEGSPSDPVTTEAKAETRVRIKRKSKALVTRRPRKMRVKV